MFDWFFVSRRRKNKRGQKASGKTIQEGVRGGLEENGTEQAFTDLTAHTLGSVTSNCRLFVGNYIIPNEIVNYTVK